MRRSQLSKLSAVFRIIAVVSSMSMSGCISWCGWDPMVVRAKSFEILAARFVEAVQDGSLD